jgi:hypothetical protein
MSITSEQFAELLKELRQKLPSELFSLLQKRDGHAVLLKKLPEAFPPETVITITSEQRAWELTGLHYLYSSKLDIALSIFTALYEHMFTAQEIKGERFHKGMPCIWISDCYWEMGFTILAKRYLMLSLCENAISEQGEVSPEKVGYYYRLVWKHGLPDVELRSYVRQVYASWEQSEKDVFFPEWYLQDLDKNWMTAFPSPKEGAAYAVNTQYVRYLISKLGEPTGKILERLADYLLSCMPGCRTTRRQKSHSTDYDIICSMEGFEVDFRSEFGRYFVCECKDWDKTADFTTMAKFCRVLDSVKARFGVLFAKRGISGENKTRNAEREQLKVFQDRGTVIVVIDENDLGKVAEGANFINILRTKYERVRLDLLAYSQED